MATLDDLPAHILAQIICYLAPEDRCKIKYVNKHLNGIVTRNPRLKNSVYWNLEVTKAKRQGTEDDLTYQDEELGEIVYKVKCHHHWLTISQTHVWISMDRRYHYFFEEGQTDESLGEWNAKWRRQYRSFWYCAAKEFGLEKMELMTPYPITSVQSALRTALLCFLRRCNFCTFKLLVEEFCPSLFTETEIKWITSTVISAVKECKSTSNVAVLLTTVLYEEHLNLVKALGCYRLMINCHECYMGECRCASVSKVNDFFPSIVLKLPVDHLLLRRKDLVNPAIMVQMLKEWRAGRRMITQLRSIHSAQVHWPTLLSSFERTPLLSWCGRTDRFGFYLKRERDDEQLFLEYWYETDVPDAYFMEVKHWDRFLAWRDAGREPWCTSIAADDEDFFFPIEMFEEN